MFIVEFPATVVVYVATILVSKDEYHNSVRLELHAAIRNEAWGDKTTSGRNPRWQPREITAQQGAVHSLGDSDVIIVPYLCQLIFAAVL